MQNKDVSIAECEICSKLADFESSFSKWGWEEQTRSMPIEAYQLEPAEDISLPGKENDHVKRCPKCGTFYSYSYSSEYLVNGSEDSAELARLTPTEAKEFLSDKEYDRLIEAMTRRLAHQSARVRHFAARSMVSHHVGRGEYARIPGYLTHPDADVVKGALRVVAKMAAQGRELRQLSILKTALQGVSQSAEPEAADSALYVLKQIEKVEARSQANTCES